MYFNNQTTSCYLLSVKIMTQFINHVLCLYILPVIYIAIKSAHFPHSNTHLLCCNQVQSLVMIMTYVSMIQCHFRPCAHLQTKWFWVRVKLQKYIVCFFFFFFIYKQKKSLKRFVWFMGQTLFNVYLAGNRYMKNQC